MKKAIVLSILISMSAQAHWFGLNCSSADQNVSYIESKMGTEVTYVKDNGEKITITTDFSQDYMLGLTENDRVEMKSIDERSCEDGYMSYYMADTYAVNAKISFDNDSQIFPAGYYVSEDGKSIDVTLICEMQSGGASSCSE